MYRTVNAHRRPVPRAGCALAGRVVAGLALGLGACGDPSDGGRVGPAAPRASLAVSAVADATTATGVELRASYLRAGGGTVEIARQTVGLSPASTQDVPLTLDLGPCLGDAQRLGGGSTCPVVVDISLLRGAAVLDTRRVGPIQMSAGAQITVPEAVALHEVETVRVVAPGGTTSVAIGQPIALGATALDRAGAALPGRTFQWASSNPGVLRVDPASGVATGVARGTATVRAQTGERTGDLAITVTDGSPGVAAITLTPPAMQLEVGATQQLTAQPRDARGGTVPGVPVTFSSNNPAVASVTIGTGLVGGVAPGSATITARATDPATGMVVTAQASVVVLPPRQTMLLSTSSVLLQAQQGTATPSATVSITSAGGIAPVGVNLGPITYDGSAAGWLRATLIGTTTPATLTLQPTSTSLAPGRYVARVLVTSPTATNSPQTVVVTFDVTQPPTASATYRITDTDPEVGRYSWEMTIAGTRVTGVVRITFFIQGLTASDLVLSGTASGSSVQFSGTHTESFAGTSCQLRMEGTGTASPTQLAIAFRYGYTGAGSGPDAAQCADLARGEDGFNASPTNTLVLTRVP